MNDINYERRNVAIKDLSLWDENARVPDKYFNQTDEELVSYFISRTDFKIRELTEAVVADFDLPQIEKVVVYDDGSRLGEPKTDCL